VTTPEGLHDLSTESPSCAGVLNDPGQDNNHGGRPDVSRQHAPGESWRSRSSARRVPGLLTATAEPADQQPEEDPPAPRSRVDGDRAGTDPGRCHIRWPGRVIQWT
jgi:hypothetical protein